MVKETIQVSMCALMFEFGQRSFRKGALIYARKGPCVVCSCIDRLTLAQVDDQI